MLWQGAMLSALVAMASSACMFDDDAANSASGAIPAGVHCEWADVAHVSDGDTIRVVFEGHSESLPVRYIGIDTPELADPEDGEQPFAPEAAARNKELVDGERVCLETDVSETDRFGRLLRYAWLEDGTLVNQVLVREGLATTLTIPPDVARADDLLAAQRAARAESRGIWKE